MRILALLLFVSFSCSASLVSNVSCIVGSSTIDSADSCYIPDNFGYVKAAVISSDSITGSMATVQAQSMVQVLTEAAPDGFRAATASIATGVPFVSAGPERPGYLQFTVTNAEDSFGASWITIADGTSPYSYTFSSCYGGCSNSLTVPFELGESFNVTVGTMLADGAGLIDPVDDTHLASAQIAFQLLEADATTPVAVSYTPEPGTVSLLVFGCLPFSIAPLWRLMRRR